MDQEIRDYDGWFCWGINEVRRWRHKFEEELNHVIPKIRSSGTAVDVGANIGISTFFLAQHFAYVYAFEPDPKNIECWRKNAVKHGFADKSQLFPFACSNKNERIGLTGKAGILRHYAPGDGITAVKLDDVLDMKIDFLKTDAEGMDYDVLQGAEKLIRKNKPVVMFEYKDGGGRHDRWNSTTASADFMKSLGATLVRDNKVDQIWHFE